MAINYNTVATSIPELSYVAPQNFYAVAENLPRVVFNLQGLTIPNVSGGEVMLPNRMNSSRSFLPGDGLDYSTLDFTFLVDKTFNNYRSILNWIKGINAPEGPDQYTEYTAVGDQAGTTGWNKTTANITVFGCDDGNNPLVHWNFVGCFPISLDGPTYDASSTNIDYIQSNVSFRYLYFENQTYTNGTLNNDKL